MSEYLGPVGLRPTWAESITYTTFYPHSFERLPTPRLTTYNVRSYSALASGTKLKKKRRYIAKNHRRWR